MKEKLLALRALADRSVSRGAVAVSLLTVGSFARADGVDISAAVTTIGTGAAAIAGLGAAYLALTVLKKLWARLGGG